MSSDFNTRLVNFLSASETRSGEAIARELACTRSAVWKHIEALRGQGIEVDAVAGQGYRLHEPLELLDECRIRAAFEPVTADSLNRLVLLDTIDSTNSWLQALPQDEQAGTAVLAECQAAGRGRRGQQWVSPFGRNIYLSLGWRFETGVGELACLPLLLALSACDALDQVGVEGHSIKWPNDLQFDGHKLGGCLVEVQGDVNGPCYAVLGVGINVRMPASVAVAAEIDQPWLDVASLVPGVSRNQLAGCLLQALISKLDRYTQQGFEPFMGEWELRDALAGEALEFHAAGGTVQGVCLGINARGGLMLRTDQGVGEYLAGEVSVVRKGVPV